MNFIISENPKVQKSEIAQKLHIGKSTFSEILKERMNVSIDVIAQFSKEFGFSLEWLINGQGDMKSNTPEPPKIESKTPQVITIDKNNEDNIVLVPVKAQAGYLNGYADPKFIEKLPTYSLPNLRNGIFRMFQVAGFSMLPTLHHHSTVVGQFVENWIDDIKDNRIYVLVTKEHGVVVKRCLNRIEKYGTLYCKSDNRKEFPSFALETQFISEIWEVKMALLHDLADPADLHDKMNDLESEILLIKQHLNLAKKLSKVSEPIEKHKIKN
ncbi:helix-turn-helix domain-containing protein [Polaribacter sp. MSW13]|uniref:Helix-turn-helix domain-containing protein n=1 Tax=Polaribacter marinus TaxID=2916838 RepID=A0A9X1VNY0_9FLAO|nr:helix-turn-helix domain-containing protein [Polaribacter marinus]